MGLTRCASTAQDATQGGAWAADLSPKAAQLDRFANAACAHYADKAAPAQTSGARLWADEVLLTPRQSATLARFVRMHYARRHAVAGMNLGLESPVGQQGGAWAADLSPKAAQLD